MPAEKIHTERQTVRLPPDMSAQLDAYCARHNLGKSEVLRGLVTKRLEREAADPSPREMERLHFVMPPETKAGLKAFCAKVGMTQSELVRDEVRDLLASHKD